MFPVSYDVDQSKIDDQTESYTIIFDKNEENFRENEEKKQRWMNHYQKFAYGVIQCDPLVLKGLEKSVSNPVKFCSSSDI